MEHTLPMEIEELITLLEEIQAAEDGDYFEYLDEEFNDD
jgi:hypothetical protein